MNHMFHMKNFSTESGKDAINLGKAPMVIISKLNVLQQEWNWNRPFCCTCFAGDGFVQCYGFLDFFWKMKGG